MKITAVKSILVSAPYASPGDSERELRLKTGFRPATFIKVETDEGVYGLGETYAGVYAPEMVHAFVPQLEYNLIGKSPFDIAALYESMRISNYYLGRTGISQCVIGGVEMALWDLKGKALGVPVYELLGGRAHQEIQAYASGGSNKPFDDLKREMFGYVEKGYRNIKIRINNMPDIGRIVEKVELCRKVIGAGIGLAADAVQGNARYPWSVKTATEIARRIAHCDLLWLEEPAEVTHYVGYAEIRRQIGIPVAGGETVTSLVEAQAYLNADALDLFQPDASVIGGIGNFRKVAQLCERKFIPVAVHCWCGGVGMMGNYHAAFATPNCTFLELPNVPNPLREEMLAEPLKLVDGRIQAPTLPGLGVLLPEGLEDRYPYRPGSVYRVDAL